MKVALIAIGNEMLRYVSYLLYTNRKDYVKNTFSSIEFSSVISVPFGKPISIAISKIDIAMENCPFGDKRLLCHKCKTTRVQWQFDYKSINLLFFFLNFHFLSICKQRLSKNSRSLFSLRKRIVVKRH